MMGDFKATTSSVFGGSNEAIKDIMPFNKDSSQATLLNALRHFYKNLFAFTNAIEPARPDIANIMDAIVEGNAWKTKGLDERFSHIILDDYIVQFDRNSNTFAVLDKNTAEMIRSVEDGLSKSELLKKLGC
jgi:hypothetical protein